jgi:hypothetical protein
LSLLFLAVECFLLELFNRNCLCELILILFLYSLRVVFEHLELSRQKLVQIEQGLELLHGNLQLFLRSNLFTKGFRQFLAKFSLRELKDAESLGCQLVEN